MRKSSRYFPEIESLRGIAILLVYLHHINGFVDPAGNGPRESLPFLLWAFVTAGHTGVSLFFVLSAFLLSLPFLAEGGGGKRVSRRDFYKRRALRILPLYYTAVIVSSVVTANRLTDVLHAVPYFVFLNSVVGFTTPLLPFSDVWWSLATEIQFYMILPLLPFFMRFRASRWLGVGVFFLYAYAFAQFVMLRFHMQTIPGQILLALSVFGRGPAFIFSVLAAWVYIRYGVRIRERLDGIRWIRAGGADLLFLATWLAMALLLRSLTLFGYWRAEMQPLYVWHVLEAFLWTAILLQMLLAPLRAKAIFANRCLARLGVLSYSIYILHLPMIFLTVIYLRSWYARLFVGWDASTIVLVAFMAAGCLALSELTYRCIERPFLVRKARLDR